jgi:hypothetical protein
VEYGGVYRPGWRNATRKYTNHNPFAELGLVDTVEVAVIPVLLGAGVPLLPAPAKRVTLKLTGHKLYAKTGIMSLEYAVQYGRGSKRRR